MRSCAVDSVFLTMPRDYFCKKCGRSHAPPTGKKCVQREQELDQEVDRESEVGSDDSVKALLQKLNKKMGKSVKKSIKWARE